MKTSLVLDCACSFCRKNSGLVLKVVGRGTTHYLCNFCLQALFQHVRRLEDQDLDGLWEPTGAWVEPTNSRVTLR